MKHAPSQPLILLQRCEHLRQHSGFDDAHFLPDVDVDGAGDPGDQHQICQLAAVGWWMLHVQNAHKKSFYCNYYITKIIKQKISDRDTLGCSFLECTMFETPQSDKQNCDGIPEVERLSGQDAPQTRLYVCAWMQRPRTCLGVEEGHRGSKSRTRCSIAVPSVLFGPAFFPCTV